MRFKYTSEINVDIDNVCDLVEKGLTIRDAMYKQYFEDSEYYHVDDVYDSVVRVVNTKLKERQEARDEAAKRKYCWRLNGDFSPVSDTYLWINYDTRRAEISDWGTHLTESEYKRMAQFYKFPEDMFEKVMIGDDKTK